MSLRSASLVVIFLTCLSAHAHAEIYAVICGDTLDTSIGPGVAVDTRNVKQALECAFAPEPGSLRITEVTGTILNPRYVLDSIQGLPIRSDDVLFVYFSGHGVLDSQSGDHALKTQDGMLWRSTLRQTVQAKGARLAVILTDCCANYGSVGGGPTVQRAPVLHRTGTRPNEVLYQLLTASQGLVDITSSTPGEFSSGSDLGGNFTLGLVWCWSTSVSVLDSGGDGVVDWTELLARVKTETNLKYMAGKAHTPPNAVDFHQQTQIPYAFSLGSRIASYAAVTPNLEYRRQLELVNETGEPLTMFLKYQTLSESGQWEWFPEYGRNWVQFDVPANSSMNLWHGDFRINAYNIVLYATGVHSGTNWASYQGTVGSPTGYMADSLGSARLRVGPMRTGMNF